MYKLPWASFPHMPRDALCAPPLAPQMTVRTQPAYQEHERGSGASATNEQRHHPNKRRGSSPETREPLPAGVVCRLRISVTLVRRYTRRRRHRVNHRGAGALYDLSTVQEHGIDRRVRSSSVGESLRTLARNSHALVQSTHYVPLSGGLPSRCRTTSPFTTLRWTTFARRY
jgi:hypothetical protein